MLTATIAIIALLILVPLVAGLNNYQHNNDPVILVLLGLYVAHLLIGIIYLLGA